MELNEEQLAAVRHPIGQPACLIAGAGSGKTATLTARVKWLIEQGIPPYRIAAVTFTTKAAGELLRRIDITSETPYEQCPHVSTIHSLSLNAIRKDPEGFGFPGRITPMDDYDQSVAVKKLIELNPAPKGVELNPWRLLEKIGYHRARGVGFAVDYTDEVHNEALERHGGYHAMDPWDLVVWEKFEFFKQNQNLVDFDDMIWLVNRRAKNDQPWFEMLNHRFHHVLCDEVQDHSKIQWDFTCNLLSSDNLNLYVVGDLAQSVYSFQGADPKLLKDFSEGWRGIVPALYRISRNHRSLPAIIRLANKINRSMTEVISLKMMPFRGVEGDVEKYTGSTRLVRSSTPGDVAMIIAREILHDSQLKGSGRSDFKDNAILVRSAIQVRDLEGALVRLRIPYVVRGGKGLLQTEEVKDLLSYFRLAVNHKDYTAFLRAVQVPKRGIGEVAVERLRDIANQRHGGDLLASSANEGRKNEKLGSFAVSMEQVSRTLADPGDAVESIVRLFGYKEHLAKKYSREASKVKTKCENIDRFVQLIQGLVADSDLSAEDLVFQLAMDRPTDEDEDKGAVTISTIHSAKGLEWKKVFLTNCTEGSIPHRFSSGSKAEIEEERRLLYVACTRARDSLAICVHGLEPRGPNTISVAPSRFLKELNIVQ